MGSLMTLLSGASLGASGMYLMDPERGHRRRAGLRETLAQVDTGELIERASQLEPVRSMRQLGVLGTLPSGRWRSRSRRWLRSPRAQVMSALVAHGLGLRRQRSMLRSRDWALLGGLVGAIAAGLWLSRRWSRGEEGVEVVRTMTVEAPIERVWEFWNDFENIPRFMSHVREVRRTGPDRTHWVVAGPGGTPIEWDAVVTRRVPNEEISWRTVEGALVDHGGTVRFRPLSDRQTQIDVRMTYRPAGGMLGHGLATLFGSDPERVIADDLSRLATHLRGPRAMGESGQRR